MGADLGSDVCLFSEGPVSECALALELLDPGVALIEENGFKRIPPYTFPYPQLFTRRWCVFELSLCISLHVIIKL